MVLDRQMGDGGGGRLCVCFFSEAEMSQHVRPFEARRVLGRALRGLEFLPQGKTWQTKCNKTLGCWANCV